MASILVVCTGNICRSPIAEGFLRRELSARFGPDAPHVSSAGVHAWDGNDVSEGSVIAASERGVDIAGHRARQVTPHLVREADLVLCMASDHRRAVADLVPEASERIFTLKELVRLLEARSRDGSGADLSARVEHAARVRSEGFAGNPYDQDVADPLGQPLQAYRAVAWELDELIRRLDRGLFGPPGRT